MLTESDPDDITAWIPALKADTGPEYAITQAFAQRCFYNIADPDWYKLLEHGLLDAILDILSGDAVAGCERETFDDTQDDYLGKSLVPYMTNLLIVFTNALVYLAERAGSLSGPQQGKVSLRYCSAEPSFVKHALEAIATKYSTFIRLLLGESSPWISYLDKVSPQMFPETMGEREEDELYEEWTFAKVLSRCHDTLDIIFVTFHKDTDVGDSLLGCTSESAKLMFQVWMHSYEWAVSDAALFGFTNTLSHSYRLYGGDPYTPFFQQIEDDMTSEISIKDVCGAVCSDLRRQHHPTLFDRLIKCIILFRQQHGFSKQSRMERSILWSSMAAFRVRICAEGTSEHSQCPDDTVVEMGRFVSAVLCSMVNEKKPRPSFSERQLHETIAVLSRAICVTFQDESNNGGINQYVKALMGLTVMLHYYSHHPSSLQSLHRPSRMPPPSVAVRNYNLVQWKITQRAMRAKCFHLHTEKRRLWAAWNSLGAKLEFGTDSSRNEFGPLQRCANQACMCSVYKCPRLMKSCKGCYLAAYCNRNCQEKDWDNHRSFCPRT